MQNPEQVLRSAHARRRYLKYLTKKFLKKHNVRDWLRVIASNKDRKCVPLAALRAVEGTCHHAAAYMLDGSIPGIVTLAAAACTSCDTSTLRTTRRRRRTDCCSAGSKAAVGEQSVSWAALCLASSPLRLSNATRKFVG